MMPNIWLQGSQPSLQGSRSPQGSSPKLQGSSPNLQPTRNPSLGGNLGGGGGGTGFVQSANTTSSGGGGGGDPAAAAQAAQIESLRSEITSRRERANAIFEALTGAVSALAREKRGELEGQFAQEQQRATEDFTQRGDELNRVYAARGLGDSSYRINAADLAGREYSRSIQDLGAQRQAGLAQVGSDTENTLARIRADKGSIMDVNLAEIGRREDGSYDADALVELRNKIDERIREAQVQQSQTNTSAGFRGKLDKVAPYSGTVDTLKNALASLVQSAAPQVVKDRLASAIISNYAPTDAAIWQQYYDEQTQRTASPTSVA